MAATLRGICAVSALAAVLGACGTSEPAGARKADGARVDPKTWRKQLSKPRFTEIASSIVYIEAVDGTQLALTLHLPVGVPAGEKLPALVQFTPYQSFASTRTYTPATGTEGPFEEWEMFVLRGAAYIEADERGSAGSAGCLDFGGSLDRSDAMVFANWIRAQDWSNGVIVSDGVSHPGMGSVVAHAAIPGLAGALAHAPVVSYYQDEWLQGAKFEDQFNGPLYEATEISPPLYASPEALLAQPATCRGQTTLAFDAPDGTFTPFWDDRHLARHRDTALAEPRPILLTHGFIDLNVHPDHTQLYWDSLPDDYPKHLIMGYWYHGYPDMSGHPFNTFDAVRHRWMDSLLLGRDNGLAAEPRVLVEDSRGTWHEGEHWPLEPSERVVFAASAHGGLVAPAQAATGEVSYPDEVGAVRGIWGGTHVAFRTAPLQKTLLVNGAPSVHLVASSDQAETKWVAYLMDESPDGSWQRISHGYVDSHQWDGEGRWLAMTPGTSYAWDLRLMPTAVVVAAGHRVTLVIASQDSRRTSEQQAPCFDDTLGGCYSPSGILPSITVGRAINSVKTGSTGTTVTLDWVPPSLTAKPPWDD